MKIDYKIEEVLPKVFALIIKDDYDRAMTFCRAQEFYESPCTKFRGKVFDIFDFMKWYSQTYKKGFSYTNDWAGFNIPVITVWNCYRKKLPQITPYDKIMLDAIKVIEDDLLGLNGYLIGTKNTTDDVFKHEVCHALFYLNKIYKNLALLTVESIKKEHFKIFEKNLLKMGYTKKVVKDEIQAFLTIQPFYEEFYKDIPREEVKKYHDKFKQELFHFQIKKI